MSVYGAAAENVFHADREYPFRTATGVVRWVLGPGRSTVGYLVGIDYARERIGADPWTLEDRREQFARAILCVAGIDGRDLDILRAAYAPGAFPLYVGASDARIARYFHMGELAVERSRRRSLRLVRERAQAHGLIAPEMP